MASTTLTAEGDDETKIGIFISKNLYKDYHRIVEVHEHGKLLQNLDQVKEVVHLLECCSDNHCFEANITSSKLLLKLVKKGIIQKDYLLTKLLVLAATKRNLFVVISSMWEIITWDIESQLEKTGKYKCPFRMRTQKHPFVAIIQQKPAVCGYIIDEIKHKYLLAIEASSSIIRHVLTSVKSFVAFVLLDPDHASNSWEARSLYVCFMQVVKALYHSGNEVEAVNMTEFLFLLLQYRKTTDDFIYENTILAEQLVLCLLDFPNTESVSSLLSKIGYHIMSLCHKCVDAKRDMMANLRLLQDIFLSYPKSFLSDEFLYLLALLLYKSPTSYHERILRLALYVVPCFATSSQPQRQPAVLKAFALPLLTTMANQSEDEDQITSKNLAQNIFINIERCLSSCKSSDSEGDQSRFWQSGCPADELLIAKHHCRLLRDINRSASSARTFVHAFDKSRRHGGSLVLLLSTLLVHPEDEELLSLVLATVVRLGKVRPKMAIEILPLLLHTSNKSSNSRVKFLILESLPLLGANKLLVSPVLKTLLMLGSSNDVLPLAIRLMKDLWKIQPRIFPYLLQLLSKSVEPMKVSQVAREELILSRTAAILEVCKLRPVQHGPDVIGFLAATFDDFESGMTADRTEVMDSVVYLSLEALKSLCEAGVSDFQTAWAVVFPKVQSSKSPIVIKGVITFLSLAAQVLQDSGADLNFAKFACNFVWQHVEHENPNVGSAAFALLANFSSDNFTVDNLNPKVRTVIADLILRQQSIKKRPEDNDIDPLKQPIPGPAYALLLQNMTEKTTEGFSVLLTKLLTKEVEALPRNISSANAAKRLGSSYEKFVEGIPAFLQSMHQKSSQPTMIPGLAAGLLSCFVKTTQMGKGEGPGRRYLVGDARVNRQMLDTLLNEVNIEHTDWQNAIMAPISWSKLMARMFDVTLEGRKAELSLQFDKGEITEEHLIAETESAAYWTRDQLTVQLMKASKGYPTMQGNSIVALAGLAVKVSSIGDKTDEARNRSIQYLDRKTWLTKVADTVMVVLDGNFKPSASPMQWCQQFSSHKSTASSLLARAAAAIAISEVGPLLISVDLERIQQMAQLLIARITGQEKAGKSSAIHFSSALGLGLLLNRLQQQRFTDVIGNEGYVLCARVFHVLEKTVFDTELCNREGAVFAYGLALCATFTESSKDSKVYAVAAYTRLADSVKDLKQPEKLSLLDEGFFFALAISTVSGFAMDLIKADVVAVALDVINAARKVHPASYVLQSAYGILLHGSLTSGLSQAKTIIDVVDLWLHDVTDQNKETEERIACVYGLLHTFGCGSFLFQFDDRDVFDAPLKNKLAVVVKKVQQLLEKTDDSSVCLHSSRLLGLLHLVHLGGTLRQSALPGNLSYLAESSLLRNLFDCLLEAGKTGPHGKFSSLAVNAIINPLISASAFKLPPVNWALILSPLMKLGFDKETRRLCLKFAILNISSSATIPTWLISWMNPSVFSSLEIECKQELLSSIDHIITFIPINKVKMVVEDMMLTAFLDQDVSDVERTTVLLSLKKLAQMPNPVQSCLLCVKLALEKIVSNEKTIKDHKIVKGIADCSLGLPKELLRDFMNKLQTTEIIIDIESVMVAQFDSSLKTMDRSMELVFGGSKDVSRSSILSIKVALQQHYLSRSTPKEREEEVSWILELMGRINKCVSNKLVHNCRILFEILASTLAVWSSSGVQLPIIDQLSDESYESACWDLFGHQLLSLLMAPSWQHLQEKVLKWLITITNTLSGTESTGSITELLKESIIHLRDTEAWKSQGLWVNSLECLAEF